MKHLIVITAIGLFASCGVNSKKESTASGQERPGEILIDLKTGVNPDDFGQRLKKYSLEKKNVVSSSLNIVLFNFNEGKVSIDDLIEEVKTMEEVENAQSNKNLHNRN